MAEEKVIRISAQDTGFGQQINRMAEDAKKALSSIGLDGLFDQADKQFDKLEDKIKSIGDELKKKSKEANDIFNDRKATGGGNDYHKNSINKEQEDYNKRSEKATTVFEKFADSMRKKEGISTPSDNMGDSRLSGQSILGKAFGKVGRGLGQDLGGMIPGGAGNIIGTAGESLGVSAGGGLGGALGGGALAAGAVAGVVVAAFAAIKMLYGMGMEDWKTESKVSATFDIDRNTFGNTARSSQGIGKGSDFGMDNKEYKEELLRIAKENKQAYDKDGNFTADQRGYDQIRVRKGLGLSEGESGQFNKFNFQDVTQRDGSRIIIDILSRSEKNGILGAYGKDLSRLPEKLEQVSSVMAMQKMSGETTDSSTAISLIMAGNKIGGKLGDDRAAGEINSISSGIKNASNPAVKAYMFESLRRKNPNASVTDIQAMMEDGASRDNLEAILPGVANMKQGEGRRFAAKQMFPGLSQQTINRLDNTDGFKIILNELKTGVISEAEAKKKLGEVDKKVETNLAAMEELGKIIKNNLTDFGEEYIARPLNDWMRGVGQGNTTDIMSGLGILSGAPSMRLMGGSGYNGNQGANSVTPPTLQR